MYTAYWFENDAGDEEAYLFAALPESIMFLPILTKKGDGLAIATITADDVIYERLPNGNWDLIGIVEKIQAPYRSKLLPRPGKGSFKRPGENPIQIVADSFEAMLKQMDVKEHYALLRYSLKQEPNKLLL